jgi:hypothetical protein
VESTVGSWKHVVERQAFPVRFSSFTCSQSRHVVSSLYEDHHTEIREAQTCMWRVPASLVLPLPH